MAIFTSQDPTYDISDLGFDKAIVRGGNLPTTAESLTPELRNIFSEAIAPKAIISGQIVSSFDQEVGALFSGKTGFNNTETGYRLGIDDTDGLAKFYIGNTTNYLNWNGTALIIFGSLTATSGSIGGFDIGSDYIRDSVNSFGMASTVTGGDDVRFWAGSTFANRATAPFRITESGAVTGASLTITGGTIGAGVSLAAGNQYEIQYNAGGGILGASSNFVYRNVAGGEFSVTAREGTTGVGGPIGIYGGDGGSSGAASGGDIDIIAGGAHSSSTGRGGYVNVQANDGKGGGQGGIVYIQAGRGASGNSSGGDIEFSTGNKTGSGTVGKFKFFQGGGSVYGILNFGSLATSDKTFTFPNTTGTIALTANKLSDFAATTSAELITVISDETGSGSLVFANTPTLITPVLGVASATSINIGGDGAVANLKSGTYTPTRSAEANLDANVTMTEAQYMRVGNTVTVSGRFTANPTTTATATSFEITLPVASNIGAVEDVAGTAFTGIVSEGAEVLGVVANDTAKIQWKAVDVSSQTWSYTFTYQVI